MTNFAGFKYPTTIYELPKPLGASGIRKKREIRKHCGPYTMEKPLPLQEKHEGGMFYLNDVFQPGRYWKYADEINRRIEHKGWFIDDFCDETMKGIVIYLPHGKFLAGWTMGEGMISYYSGDIYCDEEEAAWAANEEARMAAEKEQVYREKEERNEL